MKYAPDEIIDLVADLMRKHGPDGHIDGHEIIAQKVWEAAARHLESLPQAPAPAPLPTLELTMRVLLSYLDGGPGNAPYDEYRALEAAIAEWQGQPIPAAPAPSPDLLEAARAALAEMQWLVQAVAMQRQSHDDPAVLGAETAYARLDAALASTPPPEAAPAARDVLAERERQKAMEGWTEAHDNNHAQGEMALAAACYAKEFAFPRKAEQRYDAPKMWPWDSSWWKPKSPRRDLVRAGALILAEIERLDRLAPARKEADHG